MKSIEISIDGLQPVTLRPDFGYQSTIFRCPGPFKLGRDWYFFLGPQVGPDESAHLGCDTGSETDLVLKTSLLWLRGLFDASSLNVKLPAMIRAAKTAIFIAAQKKRCPAMRTELFDKADSARRVTKRD
jgi:hypothetical protein